MIKLLTSLLLVASAFWSEACRDRGNETKYVLRALHGGIVEYRLATGELPRRLSDVCEYDLNWCRGVPADKWTLDEWGTPVRYEREGSDYVLVSAGADRAFDTRADLVFSSAVERTWARDLAGCYLLRTRIPDLDGDTLELRRDLTRSGGYAIHSPSVFRGRTAVHRVWYPTAADAVTMEWILIDRGMRIEAIVEEGGMRGRLHGREVRASRVSCS
jgi:hypothetical protein